jgi:2-methylisocitrate lyase-like PEP mutase family enzyme
MLANAPQRLRDLIARGDLVWGPGVFDGISAHVATSVGFPMLYMTGAGTAGSRIGQPDLGLTTLTEMVENARVVAGIADVPVIADADTGFGGPLNVTRTVRLYETAGVAGIHLEDQTFPKRCGHLQGKSVVTIDEFAQRIRAAAAARINPAFFIIARTDARQSNGLDDAIRRIHVAFEAGADAGFLEAPASLAEMERVVREAPGPMLLNLATNGATPNLRVEEVRQLGYRLAIWPCATMIPAALAIRRSLEALKATGTDEAAVEGYGPRDFFAMVGLAEALEIDRSCSSTALIEA